MLLLAPGHSQGRADGFSSTSLQRCVPVKICEVGSSNEAEEFLERSSKSVVIVDSSLLSSGEMHPGQNIRLPVLVVFGKLPQRSMSAWRGFPVEGHFNPGSSPGHIRNVLQYAQAKARLWKSALAGFQGGSSEQWALRESHLFQWLGSPIVLTEVGEVSFVDPELLKSHPSLLKQSIPDLLDLVKCPEGEYEINLATPVGEARCYEVKRVDIPREEWQLLRKHFGWKTLTEGEGSRLVIGLFLRDITEQRNAYRALLASELRHRSISESLNDATIVCDERGHVAYCNTAAEKLFRIERWYFINRHIDEFIESRNGETSLKLGDTAGPFSDPEGGRVFRIMGKRPNGTFFPAEVTIGSWQAEGQRCYSFIIRDVSEREQWQARWFQAEKLLAIGQLAAGIAHELNTPIQYVGDNTRFLKTSLENLMMLLKLIPEATEELKKRGNEKLLYSWFEAVSKVDLEFLLQEVPQALQDSLTGIERVADIVRAMKDFSHPGSEEPMPVDVNQAIRTALTVARSEWKYIAEVTLNLDDTLPRVPVLANEIHQVLLNLIVNAVQAIAEKNKGKKEKGRLILESFRKGDDVVIKIEDTGIGIPEEHRNRIFEPFFTTKPPGKGTGQGLAIAYDVIVHKHKGEISFTSQVGEGTTFFIRLPIFPRGDV